MKIKEFPRIGSDLHIMDGHRPPESDSTILFFPVDGLTVNDLLDWSQLSERGKTRHGVVKNGLRRQSSHTGGLTTVNETKVALFKHGGDVFAINERCPHAGGPLHVGDIEELPDKSLCVRCPWHSWCFDLKTGKAKRPSGRSQVAQVYPTQIGEDGKIYVGFDQFNPTYFTSDEI